MPLPTNEPDIYFLHIKLNKTLDIRVGKLRTIRFRKGYYIYVGFAMGNGGLRARVGRYLLDRKRLHWHIDYLLEAGKRMVELRKGRKTGQCSVKGSNAERMGDRESRKSWERPGTTRESTPFDP